MTETKSTLFAGVLTVSDACSKQEKIDEAGATVRKAIQNSLRLQSAVKIYQVVPNDKEKIVETIKRWVDELNIELVITVGGVGVGPKDVTADAMAEVIEKEAIGYTVAIITASVKVFADSMLTRLRCGIRRQTLILNFPDDPKPLQECVKAILPTIPLARAFLRPDEALFKIPLPEYEPGIGGKVAISSLVATNTDYKRSLSSNTEVLPEDVNPGHHTAFSMTQPHSVALARTTEIASENVSPGHHITPSHGIELARAHNIPDIELMEIADADLDVDTQIQNILSSTEGREANAEVVETELGVDPMTDGLRDLPPLSVDQAFKAVLQNTKERGVEIVSSADAFERILYEDIATSARSPTATASVNGYAIAGSILEGESRKIRTGGQFEVFDPHCAVEVSCGGPLPTGANTLVRTELLRVLKEEVVALKSVSSGQGVENATAASQTIAKSGVKLAPPDIGKLASLGLRTCRVYKKPVVALFSVGDEASKSPDHITLQLLLREHSVEPIDIGISPAAKESLSLCLNNAVNKADVIIACSESETSRRYLRALLEKEFGGTTTVGNVNMQPWQSSYFGTCTEFGQKIFFLLPGRPLADILIMMFVVPAIRKMGGMTCPQHKVVKAKLSAVCQLGKQPEYLQCVVAWLPNDGSLWIKRIIGEVEPVPGRDANALAMLPVRSNKVSQLKKGEKVDVLLFAQI